MGQTKIRSPFTSKLADVDREASETDTWLDFVLDAEYINQQTHENLSKKCRHIRSMLG